MSDPTRDVIFVFRARQSRLAYSDFNKNSTRAYLLSNPIERRVMEAFSKHWLREPDHETLIHVIYLALVTPKYFRQRVAALSRDIGRVPGLQYVDAALRPRIAPLVAEGRCAEAFRMICDAENPASTSTKIKTVANRLEAEKLALYQRRAAAYHEPCVEKSAETSPENDPEDALLEAGEAEMLGTIIW